jgi:TatD DNase family protein
LQLCREPLPDILQRAKVLGVSDIIQVATDIDNAQWGLTLNDPSCGVKIHPTAGLYPSRAEGDWESKIPELEKILNSGQVVALGEVGIDLYHETHYLDRQEKMLRVQMELALKADLPMIFHIRQSYAEVLRILSDYQSNSRLRGVWHCFEGTLEQAKVFVELGWMISFSGLITYKKNEALRDVARALPADSILVETDSPYLSPEPLRKEKNEPGKVSYVLSCCAQIRGTSLEEMDRVTTDNTNRLFNLLRRA